jgi:hypothetical protein
MTTIGHPDSILARSCLRQQGPTYPIRRSDDFGFIKVRVVRQHPAVFVSL